MWAKLYWMTLGEGKVENSLEFSVFTRVSCITLDSNKALSTFIKHFGSFGEFNQLIKSNYLQNFSWEDDLW